MKDIPHSVFIFYREEVFQVEWDPNHETVLASSADDRRLMVWDLNRYLSLILMLEMPSIALIFFLFHMSLCNQNLFSAS